MIALDSYRYMGDVLFLIAAGATIVLSLEYLGRENIAPEYYALLLLATVGMMLLAGASDLSWSSSGSRSCRWRCTCWRASTGGAPFSAEAGLKYFLIGAFASAFLLYGIALVYGSTGTMNLMMAGVQFSSGPLPVWPRLGALPAAHRVRCSRWRPVPFHMWAPDVYDGAPTPVTASWPPA